MSAAALLAPVRGFDPTKPAKITLSVNIPGKYKSEDPCLRPCLRAWVPIGVRADRPLTVLTSLTCPRPTIRHGTTPPAA
jgi:hypothetical protein